MSGRIYDSKTITEEKWETYGLAFIMDGWELVSIRMGVVYIRKEFHGKMT